MTLESKKKWILPKNDKGSFLERLLEGRDISNTEEFLKPDISILKNFDSLYDVELASKVILEAVKERGRYIYMEILMQMVCVQQHYYGNSCIKTWQNF